MRNALLVLLLWGGTAMAAEPPVIQPATNSDPEGKVGERPYEMVWADRRPEHTEVLDFEDLQGWTTAGFLGCTAHLVRSREEQMYGTYTGRVTYTGKTAASYFELRPPKPVPVPGQPTAVQMWVRGNNWGWYAKPQTARVQVFVVVADAKGEAFEIALGTVNFDYWHLMHARFRTPTGALAQTRAVPGTGDGAIDYPLALVCLRVTGCADGQAAKLSFDSLQFYTPEAKPLPDLKLPPADAPWPTTPETITPTPTEPVTNAVTEEGEGFVLTATGKRDRLRWLYVPKTGSLDDLAVELNGRRFQATAGGGPVFHLGGSEGVPGREDLRAELLAKRLDGDTVETRWRARAGDESVEYTLRLRPKGKSLQVTATEHTDPKAGGKAVAFHIGRTTGTPSADLVRVPYLNIDDGPHVVSWDGVFVSALMDWYNSDASTLESRQGNPAAGEYVYAGGSRYHPKTDGRRNPLRERLVLTIATDFQEVLPNLPHPKSDTADLARAAIWRNIGEPNEDLLARLKARGVENFICPLHEVGWRDAGESFTFRLRAAPRIGDEKMVAYGQWVKSLGYRFGLYANYTDFSPVNENWDEDRVCLQSDGNWTGAWPRCYAPKPTYAWQAEAYYAPRIARKFGANTCYSDVHTAIAPWHRTDYDARAPGAGMFRTTWECYARVLWNESQAYGHAPIFSEGNMQWMYAGISDGNYGQMGWAGGPRWRRPPLVDFDLLKMHPLMCDFGMGSPDMFFVEQDAAWRHPTPRNEYFDRFLTSTLAFGHIGFLALEWGFEGALKSYYMTSAVQQRYALVPVDEIRYFDGRHLLSTSEAVRTGAYQRGQVYVRYRSGLQLWCNLSFEHDWTVTCDAPPHGPQTYLLPPTGHLAVKADESFLQYSATVDGRRVDRVESPDYAYLDSRGVLAVGDRLAGRGALAVKPAGENAWWVFPLETCEAMTLRLPGAPALAAEAYDRDGKSLGPAEVRASNLGSTIMPVSGAWRYRAVAQGGPRPALPLDGHARRLVGGLEYPVGDLLRALGGGADPFTPTAATIERVDAAGQVRDAVTLARPDAPAAARVPADVKEGDILWWRLRLKGKAGEREAERVGWFVGLASQAVDASLRPADETPQRPGSPQRLTLALRSHLPGTVTATLACESEEVALAPRATEVKLEEGKEQTVSLEYVLPAEPVVAPVTLALAFPGGAQTVRRWLRVVEGQAVVADLAKQAPARTGLAFRGKAEQALDSPGTGAQFRADSLSVGDRAKSGFFCHPPYKGGVGYAFAEFPLRLPEAPCAFETFVGFSEGSSTVDGCVFSVEVRAGGKTETVGRIAYATLGAWQEFRADLSRFAGREVVLRLVTDVGPADNSSSDWACWGDPRVVFAGEWLMPQVHDQAVRLPIGPPPVPLRGLAAADLQDLAEAKIVLDGAGVNHGQHASFVYLNGVRVGITPASASDTAWSEGQEVPVPPEGLRTIGPRNVVTIRNPGNDCMKVRHVYLEFRLKDGRAGTSHVAEGPFSSDARWLYTEGQAVPLGDDLPPMRCDIPVAQRPGATEEKTGAK